MDSLIEIYLDRANNELLSAEVLKRITEHESDKINFELPEDISFYSAVISHS